MKILELFSGTESFSKVAREMGHETFTIDIEERFKPDLCKDIMEVTLDDLPWIPDVIWASPPCTSFSIAAVSHHWKEPTDTALNGLMYLYKAFALIKVLKPKYWFIENPVGMMRKQELMECLPKHTITYCQYGDKRMKPTDIWTNAGLQWIPKPRCHNGDSCHEAAPRGSKTGTQGLKDAAERSVVPEELCKEILINTNKE